MKNIFKTRIVSVFGIIALAAVIGFSMTACGGDSDDDDVKIASTNATLKITGFPAANNGNWVYAVGDGPQGLELFAAAGINKNSIKAVKIANGEATLKVWDVTNENEAKGYNGSHKVEFMIMIYNKESLSEADMLNTDNIKGFGMTEVTFSSGTATGTFEDFDS